MARRKPWKLKAWSFSAWQQYDSCPAKFAYQRRDRLPAPSSPAMERGTDVHRKGEFYLKGKIRGVPREYSAFSTEMRGLKAAGAFAEEMWAVNADWEVCDWQDWDSCWLRAKTDAHEPDGDELTIIDFKTGRIYADTARDQAEVCAAIAPAFYDFEIANVGFWYLDQDEVSDFSFSYAECMDLREDWTAKVEPMFTDKTFTPKPSKHACRYCPYRSDTMMENGQYGPCTLWV